MADEGPTVSAKQLAMSRALGAAFLSHQVEQLEKTVNAKAASGNWRDRRQATTKSTVGGGGTHLYRDRTPASHHHQQQQQGKHARKIPGAQLSTARFAPADGDTTKQKLAQPPHGRDSPASSRKLSDEERDKDRDGGAVRVGDKDVDIVVIDASVLVHALYQVKRWCRDGREEIVIVPLEALNTLDLLKKGTTSLAQRARAASRILEAQVGTNPRIRVQRDEAYVYWDKIAFSDDTHAPGSSPTAHQPLPSPEWVRRTVCCAKWSVDNSHIELGTAAPTDINSDNSMDANATPPQHRVALAVLSPTSQAQSSSPQSGPLKLSDGESAPAPVPVVPLPAPNPQHQGNKFESRSLGSLVSYWASRAGIELLEVDAAAPGHGRGGVARAGAEEDEEVVRPRKGFYAHGHGHGNGHGNGGGRRKPSSGNAGANSPSVEPGGANKHNGHGHGHGHGQGQGQGLVERPPAVMAMMEMVSQPSKVVRVLARGEKLDP